MTIKQALGRVDARLAQYAMASGNLEAARQNFGVVLRAERQRQSVGLRDLARRINCSPAMLSDIELGRRWSRHIVERANEMLSKPRPADASEEGQ